MSQRFDSNNLLTLTQPNLHAVSAVDVAHRMIKPAEVTHLLQLAEAQWQHLGGTKPHVELTSGKHSDGFVDTLKALSYTNLCHMFAHQLIKKLEASDLALEGQWDWTVGSDHAGAVFSQNAGIWLGTRHDFTEKAVGPNGEKLQNWTRFTIDPDQVVLSIEELMTTSGTMIAVRDGIRRFHSYPIKFASVAGVLVHRSDVYQVENSKLVYLVHYDIQTWQPEECPLCKAGSKAIKEPKKHWAELTGQA